MTLLEHRKRCTEATRRYRQNHPDKVKSGAKSTKSNRRRKAFEKLGGAFCVNCGCNVLEFLEFNHKNGGGCKEIRSIGNHLVEMILNDKRTTSDYNVLCRVCNALDHLKRKNPEKAKGYKVDFTGQKAELING